MEARVVVVVDGGGELRVVGRGCGGLFPTCATGVIYLLNNLTTICPISSAGSRVISN